MPPLKSIKIGKQCHFDIIVKNTGVAKDALGQISAWEFHQDDGVYVALSTPSGTPGGIWKNDDLPQGVIPFFEVSSVKDYLAENDATVPATHQGESHPRANGRAWAVIKCPQMGIYGIHEAAPLARR